MRYFSCIFLFIVVISCNQGSDYQPITQQIPGTSHSVRLMPVLSKNDEVFWMSSTEITWDLYDAFLQIVNSPENLYAGVDAITGPTPAYGSVDRGYGRSSYPAISMSFQAADSFCLWLSEVSGRTFTLPTLEQYELANIGGDTAWHQWNSNKTTHPVGTTKPNSLGLYDIRGNVGEWVITDNGPKVVGGSFRTAEEDLGTKSMLTPIPGWNKTDPQLPRSPWWLADADFVGLRIVTADLE